MFIKIVQFEDGKYAIRRWNPFEGFGYLDLCVSYTNWLSINSSWIHDCKTADKEVILRCWDKLHKRKEKKNKGKVIDIDTLKSETVL